MDRDEVLAWLGDDHGLNEEEFAELVRVAGELTAKFPGESWAAEHEAALTAAYEVLTVLTATEWVNLVGVAAEDQAAAQAAQVAAARDYSIARAALRQAVRSVAARWGTPAEQLADLAGEPLAVIEEWLR
jgi:hypothetical protein